MSASDRALIGAFREISAMGDRINLPKTIMDRSNLLFKQVCVGPLIQCAVYDVMFAVYVFLIRVNGKQ